jgi:hypothetical protein
MGTVALGGDAMRLRTLTFDLDEVQKDNEARATAILQFINFVCLPEGAPTIEDIEGVDKEVDKLLIRIDHDITRMENPQ